MTAIKDDNAKMSPELKTALEKTAGLWDSVGKKWDAAADFSSGAFRNMRQAVGEGMRVNQGISSNVVDALDDAKLLEKRLGNMTSSLKITGGVIAGGAITGYALAMLIREFMNDNRRKALLEDLMMHDMIISKADPEKVKEFYATIYHLAPKLALDKNIVRELLQNFIKFDRVDLASVKTLVDTQKGLESKGSHIGELMQVSSGNLV